MNWKQKIGLNILRLQFRILSLLSPRRAAEKAFTLFCTPPRGPRQRRPSVFHTSDEILLDFDNLQALGYRWGPATGKKALILHGFGSAAYKFHRFVHPLLQQGYQVLAFDAPAHGKSPGKTVNVLQYARMIEEANRRYGPFDSYISHSFGGLALLLALEKMPAHPERKAVLIAPATETATSANLFFKLLGIRNQQVIDQFHELIYVGSGRKTGWFSVNRSIRKNTARFLWIHDTDDDTTPFADTEPSRQAGFSHVEFMVTSGLGHKAIYHDKTVRERILSFLTPGIA